MSSGKGGELGLDPPPYASSLPQRGVMLGWGLWGLWLEALAQVLPCSGDTRTGMSPAPSPAPEAQAFSWCHCATACRGRAIMSFQCFTSPGPLFQDR